MRANRLRTVTTAAGAAVMALAAVTVTAQSPDQGRGPGRGGRPGPPFIMILDENCNGVIDADEIARAPQLLLKLDRDGDGRLTREELRPRRPDNPDAQPRPCSPEAR
jgi:hypothetical protein